MLEFLYELNWVVIGQIILIDILLGGDNALVIALACRRLPDHLRMKGIVGGTLGAIIIRIVLIGFAVTLLNVPYLKLVGGVLLIWIGIKLLTDADDSAHEIDGGDRLFTAIRTVLVADLVMSIDNVIAVASAAEHAASEHKLLLVAFGIMVSIPIIIWGSSLILKLMNRMPAIITLGAALLGYLGGSMISKDIAIAAHAAEVLPLDLLKFHEVGVHLSLTGTAGAILVVAAARWIRQRGAGQRDGDSLAR
ncbi:MAG: TerC family protein [Burkholderiaceae bacterium]|nr:TerC family protein [Burkholderiaceae bacterium]